MENTTLKYSIKNLAISDYNVYNLNGQIDIKEGIINYSEGEVDVVFKFRDTFEIVRNHSEYLIEMKFILNEFTKGSYLLRQTTTDFHFDLYTTLIVVKDNSITINYTIVNDKDNLEKYEYNIEWSK